MSAAVQEAAQAEAIFSFQYAAAPPEGRNLHAAAAIGVNDLCGLFERGERPRDLAALNVVTTATDLDSYTIQHDPVLSGAGRPKAGYVEYVVVEGGAVRQAFRAVSGRIEILAAPPDENAWSSDAEARLLVEADFETNPVVSDECNGSQDINGGEAEWSCRCERLDGQVFNCEATDGNTCCNQQSGETVPGSFELRPRACAWACIAASPELLVHCRALDG